MKFVLILFLLLASVSNGSILTPIKPNQLTTLKNSNEKYDYFSFDASSISKTGSIYLYIEDYLFYLSDLQVCFKNSNPLDDPDSVLTYIYSTKSPSVTGTINGKKIYLYKFNYKLSDGKYVIVKYTGVNKNGEISVEASDEDIHGLISLVLSTVAIVLIVIGSIIVGGAIIIILICCCICRRRTVGGQVGYVNPQPTYVVTNTATYPLSPTGYWGYLRMNSINE